MAVTISQMLDLIDIGVNLTHESFDQDRAEVIARASSVGVRRFIITGTSIAATENAVALCKIFPGTAYATAGIHPHHASEYSVGDITILSEHLRQAHVVAIGECGLDFFRNFSPRDAQLEAFEAQLDLAQQLGKPLFLHQRDAHQDFLDALRNSWTSHSSGVAHCFTGGIDELNDYLELGLHIGVTGWVCDERRGEALRRALTALPLERLLLETDAPYLLPRDLRPKPANRRNEPAMLINVLERVAACMQLDVGTVGRAATENADRLFSLTHA